MSSSRFLGRNRWGPTWFYQEGCRASHSPFGVIKRLNHELQRVLEFSSGTVHRKRLVLPSALDLALALHEVFCRCLHGFSSEITQSFRSDVPHSWVGMGEGGREWISGSVAESRQRSCCSQSNLSLWRLEQFRVFREGSAGHSLHCLSGVNGTHLNGAREYKR